MHAMRVLAPTLLCLALPVSALAEDYVSPADLADSDRAQMVQSSNEYVGCVREQAQKLVDSYDDPRKVADAAMTACEQHLTDLGTTLAAHKLDPHFTEGYLRNTRQRGARYVLPAIMEAKAARPAAASP
jgi:hypothetical protein